MVAVVNQLSCPVCKSTKLEKIKGFIGKVCIFEHPGKKCSECGFIFFYDVYFELKAVEKELTISASNYS